MKRIFILSVCVGLVAFIVSSCNKTEKFIQDDFFAMDTFVTVMAETSDETSLKYAEDVLKEKEKTFSKTIKDSEISKINDSVSCYINEECQNVLNRCFEISENTDGAFNFCMGSIVELWDVSGKMYVPTDKEVLEALLLTDISLCTLKENEFIKENSGVLLDLGACVKGYSAKCVIDALKEKGIENAMINIGGNIAITGHSKGLEDAWRVGIKNPFNPEEVACFIDVTDTVISVSGDYERYFEKDGKIYHHIFDPKSGKPSDNDIKSVAVISKDGLLSDALSTALFVMGKDKAMEFYNKNIYEFDAVIFTKDGKIHLTEGIKDIFSLFDDCKLEVSK